MQLVQLDSQEKSRNRLRLKAHLVIRRRAPSLRWTLALLTIGWAGAGGQPQPSTAEIVRQLAKAENPLDNPFLSQRRAERLVGLLAEEKDPVERLILRVDLAVERLHAGQTEESLREIRAIQGEARDLQAPEDAPVMRSLRELAALASLRLGEQENCVAKHTSESCLMPIRGGGVHTLQRGSRDAIREYTELSRLEPGNLGYRWLLNLAFMTLGEYPDKVPKDLLIPPSAFESDYRLPRFAEMAAVAGLAIDGLAGGSIMEDFDGDGYLDLIASSWMLRDQIRYFHNNADGSFSEWTDRAGLSGQTGGLNILQADYDNDGRPDLLILRGGWLGFMKKGLGDQPNTLLRNRPDGTFEDVTRRAGLLSFHPTQTAAWADYDRDGHLDLFVGNESAGEDVHPCQLFRNNGDGTFADVAGQVGLDLRGLVKGVAWGDYDNDGWPDLYVSRFGQDNLLFHNDAGRDGVRRFRDRTGRAGVARPELSFPTWFWDYDNDGWLDLLVASFSSYSGDTLGGIVADYLGEPKGETSRLYRNNRDGSFRDVTREARMDAVLMAMGANFGDLDNDGFLDCYFGTGQPQMSTLVPNRMFRNDGGRVFQDVTTAGGFGHLQKGHGISFGDLDGDGDQDVYTVLGGAFSGDRFRNALFENPGNSNHWIALELRGVTSNRLGVGARLRVTVSTPGGETRVIYRTAGSGGSFGASSLRVHVGLGDAEAVESIEIRWPDRRSEPQIVKDPPMDCVLRIVQGQTEPETVPLKSFAIGSPRFKDAHRHGEGQ